MNPGKISAKSVNTNFLAKNVVVLKLVYPHCRDIWKLV